MSSYAPEMWEIYGLTPLTVWDLPADHFFAMTKVIDIERARRQKEAKG